jgi:Mg2+ and Co2+ transporter CorA
MAHLQLIDKLIKSYKLWTIKLNNRVKQIENTILQNDQSDAFEEKIVSIGISYVFMWIFNGIIGLFVVVNIFVSIALFFIGILLSKFINKKLFGTPREFEELSNEEKDMLKKLHSVTRTHKNIIKSINENKRIVYFKDYIYLKDKFESMIDILENFDRSHLAIKYRTKYLLVIKDYKNEVKTFHKIYAHK